MLEGREHKKERKRRPNLVVSLSLSPRLAPAFLACVTAMARPSSASAAHRSLQPILEADSPDNAVARPWSASASTKRALGLRRQLEARHTPLHSSSPSSSSKSADRLIGLAGNGDAPGTPESRAATPGYPPRYESPLHLKGFMVGRPWSASAALVSSPAAGYSRARAGRRTNLMRDLLASSGAPPGGPAMSPTSARPNTAPANSSSGAAARRANRRRRHHHRNRAPRSPLWTGPVSVDVLAPRWKNPMLDLKKVEELDETMRQSFVDGYMRDLATTQVGHFERATSPVKGRRRGGGGGGGGGSSKNKNKTAKKKKKKMAGRPAAKRLARTRGDGRKSGGDNNSDDSDDSDDDSDDDESDGANDATGAISAALGGEYLLRKYSPPRSLPRTQHKKNVLRKMLNRPKVSPASALASTHSTRVVHLHDRLAIGLSTKVMTQRLPTGYLFGSRPRLVGLFT